MQPAETKTQYDVYKKLVHSYKRDKKIHTWLLIAMTALLLTDLSYLVYLLITLK